jgi:hypothetical protein
MKPQAFLLLMIVLLLFVFFVLPNTILKPHYLSSKEDVSDKVTYNQDKSITFHGIGDNVTFTESELPQLEDLFIKADELDKELSKKIKMDTEFTLGKIDNHIFKYHYNQNGYSLIFVMTGSYESVGVYHNGKYIDFLVKLKDEHDKQLAEINKIKSKLDIK